MDRFLIAPINVGLETDMKPWLIPDDAFAELENAYVFRGRVRKRFGSSYSGTGGSIPETAQLSSRARASLGTIQAGGTFSTTITHSTFKIGQMFSVGSVIFTVNALGTPATLLKTTGVATTHTFNTTTGDLVLAGMTSNVGDVVYFYPAMPIMGINKYEAGPANNHTTYVFDTQYVYKYSGGSWNRDGTVYWTGNNDQFFWSYNWDGATPDATALFVTNFNASTSATSPNGDSMYAYTTAGGWAAFKPKFKVSAKSNGYKIQTCRIIVPFKNRLLLLNTIESDDSGTNGDANLAYTNRLRYSHNGSPFSATAFLQANEVGYTGGGYIDAPTEEDIVSAAFVKDRLIVYFERSTWELAYTGSPILPFVWQKINAELGSEATFSSVPFDKVALTIGNTGIHACSGANVVRVDEKIPQQIFDISNKTAGVARVAGIRDFYAEMVYWTFPSGNESATDTYPNKILVFNYKNGAWAFNDDCITSWGYFEQQDGYTWQSTAFSWKSTNNSWKSGLIQAQFRQVIAGNPQGYIYIVDVDRSENASVMQITDVDPGSLPNRLLITCIDHNLSVGDWIKISNLNGVNTDTTINYQVVNTVNSDSFEIVAGGVGTYEGGGTIARVSNISVVSKQWNPYVKDGRNVHLAHIDFAVQKTTDGEVTVDYFPSSANISLVTDGTASGAIVGTNVLETSPYTIYPLEASQERLWHPVYFSGEGQCIQIQIYMNDDQMQDQTISASDFQLEGLVLHTQPSRMRLE